MQNNNKEKRKSNTQQNNTRRLPNGKHAFAFGMRVPYETGAMWVCFVDMTRCQKPFLKLFEIKIEKRNMFYLKSILGPTSNLPLQVDLSNTNKPFGWISLLLRRRAPCISLRLSFNWLQSIILKASERAFIGSIRSSIVNDSEKTKTLTALNIYNFPFKYLRENNYKIVIDSWNWHFVELFSWSTIHPVILRIVCNFLLREYSPLDFVPLRKRSQPKATRKRHPLINSPWNGNLSILKQRCCFLFEDQCLLHCGATYIEYVELPALTIDGNSISIELFH